MVGFKHSLYAPKGDISAKGPEGRIPGGSLEPKAKKSGISCCGSPKTNGESDYGYELKTRGGDIDASGKPKSHVIDMGGGVGFSNDGYEGPDVKVSI